MGGAAAGGGIVAVGLFAAGARAGGMRGGGGGIRPNVGLLAAMETLVLGRGAAARPCKEDAGGGGRGREEGQVEGGSRGGHVVL